jgi:hypothetical protein
MGFHQKRPILLRPNACLDDTFAIKAIYLVPNMLLRITAICILTAAGAGCAKAQSGAELPSIASLSSDRDLPVYTVGDRVTVTAKLPSLTNDPSAVRLHWSVRDFDGATVAHGDRPAVGGNPTFCFPATQSGIYYIDCGLVGADGSVGKTVETRVVAFGHDHAAASRPSTLYGISSAGLRDGVASAEREIKMIHLAGLGATRFDLFWPNIQQSMGKWDWEKYDRLFAACAANDVVPLPLINASPQWASTGKTTTSDWRDWACAPPRTPEYLKFVHRSVARYRQYTHYWEIWNEPDLPSWLGTAEQYGDLLSSSVRTIHQVDPKAQVMNGGISEVSDYRPGFVTTFLKRADTKPDIFAYHSHGSVDNVQIARDKAETYLEAAHVGKIPIWLNETGQSVTGAITEREQALTLVKKMASAPTRGDRAVILYDIRNNGDDPNNLEDNFGLIRHDFTPKAAYAAVRTTISELSHKAYAGALPLGKRVSAFVYHGADETDVVVWGDYPDKVVSTARLKTNCAKATLVDIMGRCRPASIAGGLVTLSIGREPYFVRFAGNHVKLTAATSLQSGQVTSGGPHASAPLVRADASMWDESRPTASLTTERNLVSTYAATPVQQLHFHGDDDLSARVFVRGSRDGIMIRVRVTDDVQYQNKLPNAMWKGDSVQIAFLAPGGQYYEWTGALSGRGPQLVRDFATPESLAGAHGELFDATRRGTLTTYTLTLPTSMPGVRQALKDGCGLDVLVNDNDGAGRKGWIEWTPGIGATKDPSAFTHVTFDAGAPPR